MSEEHLDKWREKSLGWLIAVLGHEMATALDNKLKAMDLKIVHWPTLLVLWHEDGLTQAELSARCRTAYYTTTRMLDALEQKGLIERKAHPSSRRAHQVFLTEQGKAIKEQGLGHAMDVNAKVLSPLSQAEQTNLLELLLKLVVAQNT